MAHSYKANFDAEECTIKQNMSGGLFFSDFNTMYKELAMQNSHCNNGSLALTYLTNLARPYDLEPFLTKFGH